MSKRHKSEGEGTNQQLQLDLRRAFDLIEPAEVQFQQELFVRVDDNDDDVDETFTLTRPQVPYAALEAQIRHIAETYNVSALDTRAPNGRTLLTELINRGRNRYRGELFSGGPDNFTFDVDGGDWLNENFTDPGFGHNNWDSNDIFEYDYNPIIRMMIELGVNVNMPDAEGNMPVDIATQMIYPPRQIDWQTVGMLLSFGARPRVDVRGDPELTFQKFLENLISRGGTPQHFIVWILTLFPMRQIFLEQYQNTTDFISPAIKIAAEKAATATTFAHLSDRGIPGIQQPGAHVFPPDIRQRIVDNVGDRRGQNVVLEQRMERDRTLPGAIRTRNLEEIVRVQQLQIDEDRERIARLEAFIEDMSRK